MAVLPCFWRDASVRSRQRPPSLHACNQSARVDRHKALRVHVRASHQWHVGIAAHRTLAWHRLSHARLPVPRHGLSCLHALRHLALLSASMALITSPNKKQQAFTNACDASALHTATQHGARVMVPSALDSPRCTARLPQDKRGARRGCRGPAHRTWDKRPSGSVPARHARKQAQATARRRADGMHSGSQRALCAGHTRHDQTSSG